MSNAPQPLLGMSDLTTPEVEIWQTLEARARETLARFAFREVRTPVLEALEVFLHSLGDTTDIVQKEMYAFATRSGRQVCLRPEGTAGVLRYVAGAGQDAQDARLYYIGPMFRAERPQAGRKRQFHQLGVEAIGPASPEQDAEIIAMQQDLFSAWGIENVHFEVNTRGSSEDFPRVLAGLREGLAPHAEELCEDCRRRMDANVLRVLDCKNPTCRQRVEQLPKVTDFMAPASLDYFARVCELLDGLGVHYQVNPLLVRGLDYYQHTIWEVRSNQLGAQDALSGGGRYRVTFGKSAIEGVGFGIGMERAIMALPPEVKQQIAASAPPLTVLVAQNEAARVENMKLASLLRRRGLHVWMDLSGRSMKAQMKAAGRRAAVRVLLRGETELQAGTVQVRDMAQGTQQEFPLSDWLETL